VRSATLAGRLTAAVLWPTAVLGAFVGGHAVATVVLPDGLRFVESQGEAVELTPEAVRVAAADQRVRRLVRTHACWSGDAPRSMRDRVPAHAVVTLPGRRAAYLDSAVGFAVWAGERRGTLHAFCR
jgi:hypothetical protein